MLSAVVIGNGESRINLNLSNVVKNNVSIGCNAIHRDFLTDHIVCCDKRMVEEVINNSLTCNSIIYVRYDWYQYFKKIKKQKNVRLVPNLPYEGSLKQDDPINWGSGCYAVLLAAHLGYENIKLIGFDLYSKDNLVNNIYKGTSNYSSADKNSVDPSFWIYQIEKVFSHFPNSHFEISNHKHWKMPKEWQKNNVSFVAL